MTDTVRVACVNENCGTFPIDRALRDKLKRTGETFTCPSGHRQHFTDSKESELRDEIERLKNRVESLQDENHGLWDDQLELKRREKALRRRAKELTPGLGVIEVIDDLYMWRCECGATSRGLKPEEKTRHNLEQHAGREDCDPPVDAIEMPSPDDLPDVALRERVDKPE